ncbi:hypothetical protein Bbelb_050390 [Branchiostoma belcheri]|nr:hypothetical protein Bbelb_050390 [Branchiostoma belcheri]
MATEAAGAKKTAPNGEFDARPDSNAGAVITIDGIVIKGIPPDRRDVVIDAKRGTTVRSIAGKAIGRLPAGSVQSPQGVVATGPPRQSYPPWPAPSNRGGGAVNPSSIYIKLDARKKDGVVAKLKEAVDRHMAAAGTGGPTVLEEIHDVSGWMDSYLCEYHNHVEPRAFLAVLQNVAQFYRMYSHKRKEWTILPCFIKEEPPMSSTPQEPVPDSTKSLKEELEVWKRRSGRRWKTSAANDYGQCIRQKLLSKSAVVASGCVL